MMSRPTPITPTLVTLEEPPRNPDDAIEFLLDLAVGSGRVTDREHARQALEDRRAESSFGMGLGVALPHARTDAVTTPTVAFARSETGIDFDSPDGDQSHLLVLILVPPDAEDDHLDVLASLSRALVDEGVRTTLLEADDESAIVACLREVVE